jgi:hypothetical protein
MTTENPPAKRRGRPRRNESSPLRSCSMFFADDEKARIIEEFGSIYWAGRFFAEEVMPKIDKIRAMAVIPSATPQVPTS